MISFPVIRAFSTPLRNLEQTLRSAGFPVTSIIGYEEMPSLGEGAGVRRYLIPYRRPTRSVALHQVSFLLLQFRIGIRMLRLSGLTDRYFFFMQTGPLIPLILARLLGKKTVWMLPSSMERMARFQQYALSGLILSMQRLCYTLADTIVLYSADLIDEWELADYREKIRIAHEHIVDIARFEVLVPLPLRGETVGFVGRFSEEKGILSLVDAIGMVYRQRPDLRFLLIGDGPCREEVEASLRDRHLSGAVTLPGWIDSADLPGYLNQMGLLVLPSSTEGLPNVMLEAMSCGTPVLASSIGAIPAVISDRKNGYLLRETAPASIAAGILAAMTDPARPDVALAARRSIEDSFSLERTAAGMKDLLTAIE